MGRSGGKKKGGKNYITILRSRKLPLFDFGFNPIVSKPVFFTGVYSIGGNSKIKKFSIHFNCCANIGKGRRGEFEMVSTGTNDKAG